MYDGSVSVASALSLMPKPYNDLRMFLGAMRLEDENVRPMFMVLVNEHADVFSVVVVQGRNITCSQAERWLHSDAPALKSLVRVTCECNLVRRMADGPRTCRFAGATAMNTCRSAKRSQE